VETAQIAERLIDWVLRLMPPGARRERLVAELRAAHGTDARTIDAERCRDIERTAWATARHVALFHEPGGTAAATVEAQEWEEPGAEVVAARAGCVRRVVRRDDGIGVVRIDGLDPAPLAGPYVDAAFALLRGADAVVLDLRGNGGGDPATVAHIAGWLLGDRAVRLSDVVGGEGTRQWWTADRPPGSALRQPACVLVGPGTFSSGEALAYHLQARGRVTVVGERTMCCRSGWRRRCTRTCRGPSSSMP
jgi:hypothetical protein